LAESDPKILVEDDALAPDDVSAIQSEIRALEDQFEYEDHNDEYVKYRLYLDRIFDGRRDESRTLRAMQAKLFDDDFMLRLRDTLHDFSAASLPFTNVHTTSVTAHVPWGPCTWHVNDMTRSLRDKVVFTFNYVYYLDMGGRFEGGNLLVSYDNVRQKERFGWEPVSLPTVHRVVEPRNNRLVVLPTVYWHMVELTKVDDWKKPLDGRISVNGHVGFRLA
jgi:hypothetical protein